MKTFSIMAAVALMAALSTGRPATSSYITLDQDGTALTAAFNEAQGKIRVVAYVAPTCGGCLRGAKLLQDQVLDRVDDTRVEVLVAWVPKNGAQERHVEPVVDLVDDARATTFWDEHGFVVDALDERLGLTGRACAGAFLLFDGTASWEGGAPPEPTYWSDAHAAEFRQHGESFDAAVLLEELERLLSSEPAG